MSSSNLTFSLPTIRNIINGKIILLPEINENKTEDILELPDLKNIIIEQFIYDLRLINPSNHLKVTLQQTNQIFITLQGEIAHGREYIRDAFQKGIKIYWVDSPPTSNEKSEFTGTIWLISKNPLRDLQKLAEYVRDLYSIPVIGITGSNGKTIVKEWLSTLLTSITERNSIECELHKSPESFNSQLGVAISVLGLKPIHSLAIFEAGISNLNEMEKLATMIKPTIGIFTHTGDAHAAGFSSFEEKIDQKLNLFRLSNPKCNSLIVHKFNRAFLIIANYCIQNKIKLIIVDEISNFNFDNEYHEEIKSGKIERILFKPPTNKQNEIESEWEILLTDHNKEYNEIFRFKFSLFDEASTHNMELAVAAALVLGEKPISLFKKTELLKPISMRMEIIEDNAEITIWNDAYNADITSVRNALRRFVILKNEKFHHQSTKLKLILSDLEHQGVKQVDHQNRILSEAIELFGSNNIILIGKVFVQIIKENGISVETYENIDLLISEFNYEYFKNSCVLLKGSRKYELERLIPYLSNRPNSAYLKINLSALRRNFLILRKKIPAQTGAIAMLKAAAYGGGLKQIAIELEKLPINYFAVAFTGEGIELRKNGILKPTLVLNPDETSLSQIFNYNLEPVISSFKLLNKIILEKKRTAPAEITKIHLEFDTGMGRLGFNSQDANRVLEIFQENQSFELISIFTHLSSADEIGADEFTNSQLTKFKKIIHLFIPYFPNLKFHALNTAGIIRFGQFENSLLSISAEKLMVRLGIGLYGVDPVKQYEYDNNINFDYSLKENPEELEEIVSLIVSINQIHEYEEGIPIGYGREFITQRKTRIATLPIGYADGIPRCIGLGKYSVFVHGKLRPVVGKICMDMMMIDVTDEPFVNESDEVLIFGKLGETFLSVCRLSAAAETIPYEILTGIGPRVRRVYVNE